MSDNRLLAQQFHIEDQQANRLHDRAAAYFDCPDCHSVNPWFVPRHEEVDLSWINEATDAAFGTGPYPARPEKQ